MKRNVLSLLKTTYFVEKGLICHDVEVYHVVSLILNYLKHIIYIIIPHEYSLAECGF